MKNKKKFCGGFSYVEILVALGLFSIMLAAVLPMLLQAGRNMRFAESHYIDHLLAQGMMLTVRDALLDHTSPQTSAATYASSSSIYAYSVWIFGEQEQQFNSVNMPKINIDITNTIASIAGNNSIVVVVVCDASGNVTGRAIGIAYIGLEATNEIP